MTNTIDSIAPAIELTEVVRSFQFEASQADLDDLKRRVQATKFPEKEPVGDNSQGVPLATVQALAKYWGTEYDWRKVEKKMNSYPHFITEIDGLDIHFIHVRSKHENALPILVTHGWPGSIIEQLKIIDPLTDPTSYGGQVEDAFDVVIPSIPGFGFSGKPSTTGWDVSRIGRAWVTLMKRIGYDKFLATGGDWGGLVTDVLAAESPDALLGIHTNFPGAIPTEIDQAAYSGAPTPANLTDEEKQAYERLSFSYKNVQYAFYMASRPQTLVALNDSPVGLATWMLDHDPLSLELIIRSFEGQDEGLTRDDVLDNATLFWLTNTGVSSSRIYLENKHGFWNPKGVTVPVAVSIFPDEIQLTPRHWAEKAYPNLIHYNKVEKGGHFAAWEKPEIFVEEVRAGFKSLR